MGWELWLSSSAVELGWCFEVGELTIDLDGGASIEEREEWIRESEGLDFVACNDRTSSDIIYGLTLVLIGVSYNIILTYLVRLLEFVKSKLGLFDRMTKLDLLLFQFLSLPLAFI